jgi:predicted transcriptional regulator
MKNVATEQADLWERFQVAYNNIDRQFRKLLNTDRAQSFTSLIKKYEETHRLGADGDYLRMTADLRNVLVHEKTKPYVQLAIPTEEVVERLEVIAGRISNPPRLLPRFQKVVEVLELQTSLAQTLRKIARRDYSQFPVYHESRFWGLLTENGITRWLAHHMTDDLSLVDFEDVPIKKVLPEEEKRSNCLFMSRDRTIDEVEKCFREEGMLEAVLITHNGNKSEKLLGIVTRWDILH